MPSEVDNAVVEFLEEFCEAQPATRDQIRTNLTQDYTAGLLSFAARMAVLAVRERSPKRVLDGLLAIAIEDCRVDTREDYLILSLLLHSGIKIGADLDTLFGKAAVCARPYVAQVLQGFLQAHRNEKKLIRSMGFQEVQTTSGFDYIRYR
jgi:hypothetical protein